MKKILLIGNGKLGKALFSKFEKSGFSVAIFDKEDLGIPLNRDLQEFSKFADFVFICAPTSANEDIINKIKDFSKEDCVFVSFSKGMNPEGETAFEILDRNLQNFRSWAIVGGPMLSGDIDSGMGVVASIGSLKKEISDKVKNIFDECGLKNEVVDDPQAVSFFGILKNIYAVGFGMVDGLNVSSDRKNFLFEEAKKEMDFLCIENGFDRSLVGRPVGAGDLIATGNAEGSSNRNLGLKMIKNEQIEGGGESLSAFSFIEQKFSISNQTPFLKFIIDAMNNKYSLEEKKSFLKDFKS